MRTPLIVLARMRRILAATIVCAFALVTIVSAEEAEKRALAEELLDGMDMQQTIEKSFEMVKQMIPTQLKQMNVSENASSDKFQDAMQKMMDLIMKEISWEKLKDDYIAIYAETFTEEELSGLVTFYKSSIGRKLAEKQPELMKRSMQISQEQIMELMPKIQKLTQEMMEQETAQPQDSSDKSDQEQTPAFGDAEDLTRKWGPEEQPDPNVEPLQFLYWRVDAMFERGDMDGDGRMDMDEFAGEAYNFERIDLNGDGFLTKKEVVDDMIPVLRAEGKIP